MKRLIALLLALIMCFMLAACGDKNTSPEDEKEDTADTREEKGEEKEKKDKKRDKQEEKPEESSAENSEEKPESAREIEGELDLVVSSDAEPAAAPDDETEEKSGLRFTQLASGNGFALGLDTEGRIWGWGLNRDGSLGMVENKTDTPVLVSDKARFTRIEVSYSACFAIDDAGNLWAWGCNDSGFLGTGAEGDAAAPIQILSDVKSVSAGYYYAAAVTGDGRLYTWGYGQYKMLLKSDTNDTANILTPTPVETDLRFTEVICGKNGAAGAAALTDTGTRCVWGVNSSICGYKAEQIGVDAPNGCIPYTLKPVTDDSPAAARYVFASGTTYAIDDANTLYISGGKGSRLDEYEAEPSFLVYTPLMEGIQKVVPSLYGTLLLDTNGNIWGWGANAFEICPEAGAPVQLTDGIVYTDVIVVTGGVYVKGYALDSDGVLYSWGSPEVQPEPMEVPVF